MKEKKCTTFIKKIHLFLNNARSPNARLSFPRILIESIPLRNAIKEKDIGKLEDSIALNLTGIP